MCDPVVTERFGVVGIVAEHLEGISVETVQAVARPDPYIAAFVLHAACHHIIA